MLGCLSPPERGLSWVQPLLGRPHRGQSELRVSDTISHPASLFPHPRSGGLRIWLATRGEDVISISACLTRLYRLPLWSLPWNPD